MAERSKAPTWKATCDKYRVPAAVAIQIEAGLLDVGNLDGHPARAEWERRYQAEAETLEGDDAKAHRKLKQRRAQEIAEALGLRTRSGELDIQSANAVLNDTYSPREALQRARNNQTRWEQERIHTEMVPEVSRQLAVDQGIPETMAREVVGSLASQDVSVEAALAAWATRLQESGFAAAEDLMAAWQEHRAWTVGQFQQCRERTLREANAGMLPERIAQLCDAGCIEDTLRIVFHLNHWAKAREHLLYVDRQGLYRIKAALLRQAFRAGLVDVTAYVDGMGTFDPLDDVLTDCAIEWFEEVLRDACTAESQESVYGDGVSVRQRYQRALELYWQATGHELLPALAQAENNPPAERSRQWKEIPATDLNVIEAYIRRRLDELQAEARASRQPIPISALQSLFLQPDDFRVFEARLGAHWADLDEDDLGVLDPEHLSLVSFRYASPTARYCFHLPFRVAEKFAPAERLRELQTTTSERTREAGEFYGREISAEESLQHPVRDLLDELGVDVSLVCPQGLVDKGKYVQEKQHGRALRAWEADFEDEGSDEWDADDR